MGFLSNISVDRKYEILGVLLLGLTALLFLVLATDGYQGDTRRPLTDLGSVPNALGMWGAFLAGFLYLLVGQAAHLIYVLTCVWGMMLIRHRPVDRLPTRAAGFLLLVCSTAGLFHVDFGGREGAAFPGGAIGAFVASVFEPTFGVAGANVITVALALIGILLATEFLFVRLFAGTISAAGLLVRSTLQLRGQLGGYLKAGRSRRAETRAHRRAQIMDGPILPGEIVPEAIAAPKWDAVGDDLSRIRVMPPIPPVAQDLPFDDVPVQDESGVEADSPSDSAIPVEELPAESDEVGAVENSTASSGEAEVGGEPTVDKESRPVESFSREGIRRKFVEEELPTDYEYPKQFMLPDIAMLEDPPIVVHREGAESLRKTGRLLEETLETFGIQAQVTDVTRGPTITRFELEPAPGIKVNRFTALADDLALALKAHRVRIEAPIPGKGKVGIEVPSETREAVVVRELLESEVFRAGAGPLMLALGKDIAGDPVATDLATMPHLLIAGATGAGKTVCVKSILASLLFTKTPEELQLMLIDPKMVELSIFNDIPHLITPVVIDPKKAATSLNWLINEMEERYRLFAHLRVRNIEVYNESVENGEIEMADSEGAASESIAVIRKLPYIVCIIDELADLMMLARAEVEDAIARLAQLARAVGIHLIIATQRPSVDVLTGVIKANFPARISFQVSSRVDSRCILDEIGAERLIGRGDMLYLPPGQSKPTRIQAAFVSDEEMANLISYLKRQAPPQYRDEIENFGKAQESLEDLADQTDDLFDDAVRVVMETGQASISMVQRRLRVGYTRAARLVDMMEIKGIVGPHVGSKARDILVSTSQNEDEVA